MPLEPAANLVDSEFLLYPRFQLRGTPRPIAPILPEDTREESP